MLSSERNAEKKGILTPGNSPRATMKNFFHKAFLRDKIRNHQNHQVAGNFDRPQVSSPERPRSGSQVARQCFTRQIKRLYGKENRLFPFGGDGAIGRAQSVTTKLNANEQRKRGGRLSSQEGPVFLRNFLPR